MNTDSLTDFSWSRHQINVLITSGVVENRGTGAIPYASHQRTNSTCATWQVAASSASSTST